MTLKDLIASDQDMYFNQDEFGETAVYNGTEIQVVEAQTSEENTGLPGFAAPMFSLYVKESDVPKPTGGDVVVYHGMTCTVRQFPTLEGLVWRIELEQDAYQV